MIQICSIEGCGRPVKAKALCSAHYSRLRHGLSMEGPIRENRRGKNASDDPCTIEGCDRSQYARGTCKTHYERILRGEEDATRPIRYKRPDSGEEGLIAANGYRRVRRWGHPNADKQGDILEHRFLMSEHLGRPLVKGEEVHHKNGVRHDNRIENLELWNTRQPAGQRPEDKVAWAKEVLALYEPEALA